MNCFITPLTDRRNNLAKTILSISGWRKIFAPDADEESMLQSLCLADQELLSAMAMALSCEFKAGSKAPLIIIGRDTRPTGRVIQNILYNQLAACGCRAICTGILAIGELLAYVRYEKSITGFIYISASHNPPGYNGIKPGGSEGSIFTPPVMQRCIKRVEKFYLAEHPQKFLLSFKPQNQPYLKKNIAENSLIKKRCEKHYAALMNEIVSFGTKKQPVNFIRELRKTLINHHPSLVCDFNGSARILSIDKTYLEYFGTKLYSLNDKPGVFKHRIVPEGTSLEPAGKFMSESSKNFFFAWVPDCDGDRGNIVINDPVRGIIYPDAQSTFMLSVLSELAFVKIFFPGRFKKICVTVNDATSLRIEKIAGFFNIPVFTAETGEANVLGLARIKNQHGYIVRMAGEGSNGGNITFPGLVRDPLSTVMSLLKLIFLSGRGTSLFAAAAACFNIDPLLPFNERLAAIIAACPFHTTSAFESEALLKVRIKKYPVFKALYEKHLRERFPEFAGQNRLFKKYEIYNYEGARERKGQGNRSGDESGGLRVILYGDQSQKKGFLWMRGSRTEPVLRLMADIEGSRKNHDELLSFHRRLIEKSLMKQS